MKKAYFIWKKRVLTKHFINPTVKNRGIPWNQKSEKIFPSFSAKFLSAKLQPARIQNGEQKKK